MTTKKFEILVLNSISQVGLKRFPEKGYKVSKDASHPDAILAPFQVGALEPMVGYVDAGSIDVFWNHYSNVLRRPRTAAFSR